MPGGRNITYIISALNQEIRILHGYRPGSNCCESMGVVLRGSASYVFSLGTYEEQASDFLEVHVLAFKNYERAE